MCGIAAIYSYSEFSPPVNQAELLRMGDRMRSRGPDGEGCWVSPDRRVGMAHRRLAIIDLSDDGAQPMRDPDNGNTIVFNGEIYNFHHLRAELERAGCRFRSTSDTEVLLKLYSKYGESMLPMLRGMFAFVIHDARLQSLFVARDPFGIKPLYLADDGKTLRIASQVKALLAGGAVDTRADAAGHVGFFLWGHVPEPYTLYRGIRALPAGACLHVSHNGRKEQRPYFVLANELAQARTQLQNISKADAQDLLRQALLDSVRHHLIADVPVGVFLSAGLDSATLAALAKQAGVLELRTVTLGFEEFVGSPNDETGLARQVADDLGTVHKTQWIRRDDFAQSRLALLRAMDQPSIDGVNTYFASQAANRAGLKVAISGLGGDELFGGYSDFQSIPRMVKLMRPLSAVPGLGRGFRWVAAPILRHFMSSKAAGLVEYGGDYAGAYLLRWGFLMPWELHTALDGELVREGWRELETLKQLRLSYAGLDSVHAKVSALETSWYMGNQLLRDSDWASMAHSLEIRVPLVDAALTRVVAGLVNAGYAPDKLDMAAAPMRALPTVVLQRRKTGFSIPVGEWLSPSIGDASSGSPGGLRGWARSVYHHFTNPEPLA